MIDARFPQSLRIPRHTHETACLSVVMEGAFSERLLRRDRACARGSVLAKPPLEPHDDAFGRSGSRQLIIEMGPSLLEAAFDGRRPWDDVVHARAGEADALARSIAREMVLADGASNLAIEGLTLELLALVWRSQDEARPPPTGSLAAARA